MRSRMKDAIDLLRAYDKAVDGMRADGEMTARVVSAGFVLPPKRAIGRGVDRAGFQVFVKVCRYDEARLKADPESGGLFVRP